MEYRILGKTGIKVSEVGLGCEHLQGLSSQQVQGVVEEALNQGINVLDIFMSEPQVRSDLGTALKGKREQVVLQGHIGAAWLDGQYCRTRDLKECKHFFQDFMERLQTDYVDIGMIHFVDTEEDFQGVFQGGIMEYAQKLKKEGILRAVGVSSHNPVIAAKLVETGLVDVLMFSVNAAYDVLPETMDLDAMFVMDSYRKEGLQGVNPARDRLYKLCEATGTGITVMKGFGAGALLQEKTSPFGVAMTPAQCIHYALTRPAVSSILVGCKTLEEVRQAVEYENATPTQRDYTSVLGSTPLFSLKGKCMYCNHCLPCPSKIDIAAVQKYLDLALLEGVPSATVKAHYEALEANATDCIECGSCESNCPFGVPVIQRMRQAKKIFSNN